MQKRESNPVISLSPITVDITGLMQILSLGKNTAAEIAEAADAVFMVGRRRVYNVSKVRAYIDARSGKGDN